MPTATVTSKGQITIPKEIRDLLRLQAGHRVEFETDPKGKAPATITAAAMLSPSIAA